MKRWYKICFFLNIFGHFEVNLLYQFGNFIEEDIESNKIVAAKNDWNIYYQNLYQLYINMITKK
jgi:hypothetical protein